jgi:predicted RNA-binding protein with TRAM domain
VLKLSEFGREFGRAPPVEVGDIREVRIEAVGSEGDGIAKVDGFVVFVPGVKVDDVVTIRITKVLRKYGFAEVVE